MDTYLQERMLLGETVEDREGFVLKKAYGSTLVDESGKKYIDFTSGWNVVNIGWSRPEIADAITEQMTKFPYSPMWCSTDVVVNYAKSLQKFLPKRTNTFFKTTGGTESNELALKIARAYTGKKKVLSFHNEYHGQTFGSISLGNSEKTTNPFKPLVPGFIKIQPPYNYKSTYGENITDEECSKRCLKEIKEKIESEGNVAAFLCEAIQTCPGVIIPQKNFFKNLRKICDDNDVLLIIDEVGTGFARTGRMFGFEHFDFEPDIITFAKGITNGYGGMGAVATSRKIANSMLGKGGTSTFGWHTLSVVAAAKILEIIQKENLIEKAKEMGNYMLEKLKQELTHLEIVGDIRGAGLEIGVELITDKKSKKPNNQAAIKVKKFSQADGLHIVWSGRSSTILVMPPIIITKNEADKGIEILVKNLKKVSKL